MPGSLTSSSGNGLTAAARGGMLCAGTTRNFRNDRGPKQASRPQSPVKETGRAANNGRAKSPQPRDSGK